MTDAKRKAILGTLLAASLAAAAYVSLQDESAPEPETAAPPERAARTARPATRAESSPAGIAAGLGRLDRPPAQVRETGLFAAKSWYVPPPPPPPQPEAPPAPPSAPPVPYAYFGKMIEDGAVTAFLARQNEIFVVRKGDVIESTYRVDELTPEILTLTYLPLNTQQSFQIGGAG